MDECNASVLLSDGFVEVAGDSRVGDEQSAVNNCRSQRAPTL